MKIHQRIMSASSVVTFLAALHYTSSIKPVDGAITFEHTPNTACRVDNDAFLGSPSDPQASGDSNKYFDVVHASNKDDCDQKCISRNGNGMVCTGAEYGSSNGRCELWKQPIGYMEPVNGYDCTIIHWSPPITDCIQTDVPFDAGYGTCDTYAPNGEPDENYGYCETDLYNGIFAEDACAECGKCHGELYVPPRTTCPVDWYPALHDKCEGDFQCEYGEETCCGETHTSVKCECSGGYLSCFYTEACFHPQCDSIYGSIYVQSGGLGVASYHFNTEDDSYISYENAPSGWRLDDGSKPPSKKIFDYASFDETTRTFTGYIYWPVSFNGSALWVYEMFFSEDLSEIVGGQVESYGHSNLNYLSTHVFGEDLMYEKN